jgi:hypothetical protein
MNLYNFIYTTATFGRYYRHIAFWVGRFLFLCAVMKMNGYLISDYPPGDLQLTLLNVFFTTVCEILYTYTIVYFVVPRLLLTGKYASFIVIFFIATLITIAGMIQIDYFINGGTVHSDLSLLSVWAMFWGHTGYGPPMVCGLFMVIKALKIYIKKAEEKEALIRENANVKSQFLKAQVHPHFLFNTLNSIYSYTLNKSPYAGQLIDNLCGTMQYMMKDCEAALVPLEQELKMVGDYIELEKVRYDKRLTTSIEIEGEMKDKMIDPLLIIPLVENCFKHGASQIIGKSWIKLHILIKDPVITVQITNNKPAQANKTNKSGIGLSNIRKRLEILHPENHVFQTDCLTETFIVYMQIPLVKTSQNSIHAN